MQADHPGATKSQQHESTGNERRRRLWAMLIVGIAVVGVVVVILSLIQGASLATTIGTAFAVIVLLSTMRRLTG